MSKLFFQDFTEDIFNNKTFIELKTALQKAVESSPKSTITACYPQKDYEDAVARMNITANLTAIRNNPNDTKAITIIAGSRLGDGNDFTYDEDPDFAKMEMSYAQFCNMDKRNFTQYVVMDLAKKLNTWNEVHSPKKDPDPFNAFDGEPELPKEINSTVSAKSEAKPTFQTQPPVQPDDSSPSGCLIAVVIGVMIFLFFILPRLL